MPSPQGSSAKLLGNIEGIRFSSTNQVVVIDKGTSDSLKQGSVFDLKKTRTPFTKMAMNSRKSLVSSIRK